VTQPAALQLGGSVGSDRGFVINIDLKYSHDYFRREERIYFSANERLRLGLGPAQLILSMMPFGRRL
jgi:hypothetical protein